MAFIDDKRDGLQTDSELDPVDEILKRINEKKIEIPDSADNGQNDVNAEEAAEPAEEVTAETAPAGEPEADTADEILDDETICIRCGKNHKDTSVSEDYEFCAECRQKMLKAPLNWRGFIAAIATIIIGGFAVLVAAYTAMIASPVLDAQSYTGQKRLTDALTSYTAAEKAASDLNTQFNVENLFTTGTKTFVKKMQVTAKASSPLAVGETLKTAIKNAKSYKLPWLKPLKQYSDEYTLFQNTQKAVEPLITDYQQADPKDVPYDKLIAKLDALKTGKDAKKYSDYFIEYYKTYVAVLANKGAATELKHMLAVKKLAPGATWLYDYYLADCYKRLAQYDKMIAACDELLAENVNSIEVYSLKARAYASQKNFTEALKVCNDMDEFNTGKAAGYALKAEIYRRKGDLKTAESLCAQGVKKSEGSTELYRQQAIVLLLKGEKYKSKAYEAAYNAYNSAYYNSDTTLELLNTIALCAKIAGETDMYKEAVSYLTQNGYKLSDSVAQYFAGKMTLEEIFITGKGDVV